MAKRLAASVIFAAALASLAGGTAGLGNAGGSRKGRKRSRNGSRYHPGLKTMVKVRKRQSR